MKINSPEYSGILLAGGKSSRMGEDKSFIRYRNRYLYEYSLSVLKIFSGDILISSSNTRFEQNDYRLINDEIAGIGPLGGIYSCLKNIRNNSAIILPCDLPYITENIINNLLKNSEGFDITVALNHSNLPEPLIGVYSSSLVPVIKKMIEAKQYKLQSLFSEVKTSFVQIPGVSQDAFRNINNPDEYNSLNQSVSSL